VLLPPARSALEASIAVFLEPCPACAAHGLDAVAETVVSDGEPFLRFAGPCPACATPREYLFPRADEVVTGEQQLGGESPSQVLDAGQWVRYALFLADGTPEEPDGLAADDRADARLDLLLAADALAEALKFLPPDADELPRSAVWTDDGLAVFVEAPSRFGRSWLTYTMESYRRWAGRFGS
jgi:hypothetical protein